ncbi:MAG: hypothetical protein Q7S74_05400 [Nanoarchaeota archaeon]|nr:hypothetical protein [Nanoarchaeota archaeon]
MRIESTELRVKVNSFYEAENYDGIGNLEQITIFERRNSVQDNTMKYGCVTWMFSGDMKKVEEFTENPLRPSGYKEVEDPQEGDYITYFFPARFNKYFFDMDPPIAAHSGIYIGNGRVRSKFRESYVYDHPLEAVPLHYGSEVKFFRKIETAI